jgi:tetratricopeptide (TPR) repeat protein
VLGQRRGALGTLDNMLTRWPEDLHARASRAHLRAETGDAAGALADYDRLTGHSQATAAHWFNQGFLQEAQGLLDAAEASFTRALHLDDKLDRAWFGLGLVLVRQGRLDEAIAALQRNTQLQPMSPHAWYELARIHEQRREPEEVVRIIRHLQGFEPKVAARLARETGLIAKVPAF